MGTLRRVTAQNRADRGSGTGVRSEYDFVPTRSDYVALLRNMPMMLVVTVSTWVMVVLLGLLALMSYFLVGSDGQPAFDREFLLILLVLGVPAAVLGLGCARLGGLAAWRKPANREPVHAVLDADGFGHTGPSGAQSFVWGVASRADETPEAYYVYVPNGVSSLVFWLPKRAVPIGEHAAVRQQIQTFVRRYRIR